VEGWAKRIRGTGGAERRFDVAILGTGIAGTVLGAILAKNGVRVLVVEQGSHPRFAIGESTVPETGTLFRILAARYGVPEIAHLSGFNGVRRNIGTSSGVKRNFSFVFHRSGEAQRPEETSQLASLAPPIGPDVHLYRQDVDAYMLAVAASYGAVVRQRTDVTGIAFGADGVTLRSRQGTVFDADYVVDAGGVKSPIARMLGSRHELVEAASREIDAFGEGIRSATETASRIFDLIVKSGLWPAPWGSPRRRHPGIFTVPTFIPLIGWIKSRAPEALRKTYAVNFQFRDIIAMCADEWTSELKYDARLLGTLSRDFVRGTNRDWTRFVGPGANGPRESGKPPP
jgi:glycine/D-amino acid oxidase-like deaminating enzyme